MFGGGDERGMGLVLPFLLPPSTVGEKLAEEAGSFPLSLWSLGSLSPAFKKRDRAKDIKRANDAPANAASTRRDFRSSGEERSSKRGELFATFPFPAFCCNDVPVTRESRSPLKPLILRSVWWLRGEEDRSKGDREFAD